jgi:glycosyltransferase involved in cell wall biosynthesis
VKARVVTVHDVTPITMPERHVRATVKGFLKPRELKPADHVVMGSQSSREDFFKVFAHEKDRTHVIYYGIDHEVFRPGESPERGPPYILSVGMIEPRKNLVAGLRAFEALAPEHPDLRWKVVGRKGWGWADFERALLASAVKDRVEVLGERDDRALADLYRGARCLLFPSRWEGFGIPVVEALACGTRVAASRIPSLVEVAGGQVELFDPTDTAAIAEAVRRAAFEEKGRDAAVRAGIERASAFSWEKCAEQHLDVYAAALNCEVADLKP